MRVGDALDVIERFSGACHAPAPGSMMNRLRLKRMYISLLPIGVASPGTAYDHGS